MENMVNAYRAYLELLLEEYSTITSKENLMIISRDFNAKAAQKERELAAEFNVSETQAKIDLSAIRVTYYGRLVAGHL